MVEITYFEMVMKQRDLCSHVKPLTSTPPDSHVTFIPGQNVC